MLSLMKAMASTGGANLLSQVLGILTNKILAVVMGPAGVGMFGLYRQLLDTAAAIAGIGTTGGLVQGLSSTEGEARLRRLKAALVLNIAAILLSMIGFIVMAPVIAEKYFQRPDPAVELVVRWLWLPLAVIEIGMMLWNFINVSRSFRWLAFVMIGPPLGSLLFAYPLALQCAQDNQWGYFGLLLLPPLLQILMALPVVSKLGWLREMRLAWGVEAKRADYAHYFHMYGSSLIAYLAGFVLFMVVPPLILANYGPDHVGFFRVAWTLGIQNLSVLFASIGTYLFPMMAGAKTEEERQRLFNDASTIMVILGIPMIGGLILFQPLIIRLLYAESFLPAIDMLHWMLLGNYFKTLHFLFINVSTTRAHMMIYTVTESALYIGMLLIGGMAVAYPPGTGPFQWLGGIEGVGFAYFALYAVLLAVTAWVTWRRYGIFTTSRTTAMWLVGLGVVLLCEVLTWRAREIDWPLCLGLSVLCCVTPFVMLDRARRDQVIGMVRSRFRRRSES
jgi:O-antigen/teichoic acid export membrane protein